MRLRRGTWGGLLFSFLIICSVGGAQGVLHDSPGSGDIRRYDEDQPENPELWDVADPCGPRFNHRPSRDAVKPPPVTPPPEIIQPEVVPPPSDPTQPQHEERGPDAQPEQPSVEGAQSQAARDTFVTELDKARQKAGSGKVMLDPALQKAAEEHAAWLAKNYPQQDAREITALRDFNPHSGKDGLHAQDRAGNAGFAVKPMESKASGANVTEGIAFGATTPEQCIQQLDGDEHGQDLRDRDWNAVGAAVVGKWCVVMYGKS